MLSGVTQLNGLVSKQIFTERRSTNQYETVRFNHELSRVIHLLEDPLCSSLKERHMFMLKKVVKTCQRGFLLRDLADIFKIINICAEKAPDDLDYGRVLCDLLHICGRPFLKEKTSDEINYASVVMDCLSQMGYLMRVPVPEIRRQICSSVMALYSCDKPRPGLDGACPTRADYRGLMVERSGLAETLVMSLPLMENQLPVKLCLLQTLQIMSRTSEVNCHFMLKAQAAQKICYHMGEHDPSGQVLFRSSEILWNLLENGSKEEVTTQLSNTDCIESLKQAFLHQLLNGFRHYDQQLRNDLLVLTSMIAANPHAPFTESGFIKHLTLLATFPELKSHNPLVRNLRLSFNHEDFEMKKLLLNVIVVLSKDLSALQLFREGRVMLALMLLIKPRSVDAHGGRHSWTSGQQEELQLQALATLSTLAPLMLDDYITCQANTCLLLLLDWCLHADSFSGQGHSFHGTGGRGGKKAQMRFCIRVLRSVVCVGHELLIQDLCDQGALGQLLGVLRWFLDTQETEDDVSLEIQMDSQLILSVLCEGDLHRKELFGSDGVEILLQYLNVDAQLIFSGLGHNKLLLSTVDCVWSCVIGCFNTEDVFLERRGVHLLLRLLQASPRHMLSTLIGTLLELCENPQALPHVLSWRGEKDVTATQLLLQIWRKEEELMGVTQDQRGSITGTDHSNIFFKDLKLTLMLSLIDVKQPEDKTSSHDLSASVREVSENLCANIYCLFCKLGFQQLSGLSTADDITLSIISQYLDFKVTDVWAEISTELSDEGLMLISSDDEALKSIRQIAKDTTEHVHTLQQNILDRQHHVNAQEERRMYAEISFTHKQRELAAEAWRDYVARTSNYSILKEFKKLRDEWSTRGTDVTSHVTLDGTLKQENSSNALSHH
ncbi:cilia- and flagella-associated protein 69-like isoform X2 [Triplophysa dalaica]|uniref:cilia- and flagella-associated protein 69-like isoform X2 n=1 Tax=Triplophysa dalaica TaxID=1582913 RepID=UPI0024DF34F9|nr:cilia- and flagella-associated protein 69-like isoform X2 [Triplophysa dalaica]